MSPGGSERAATRRSQTAPGGELGRLIDWEALGRLGFEPGTACFAPGPGDPIFGFTECKAACCDQVAKTSLGLCWHRDAKLTRPVVERLLDAEAARDAIGQVAVPFGICTEPTNVKAHGQACPFRHQCFGCTYFRSDPSFLPELRGHLTRLLADQERLRAAVPELEEWARHAAVPSAQEIASLRRIIGRCEELVANLPEDERADVEDAVAVLRRIRAQLDTSIPVRLRGVISQPSARLFPNVERDQRASDAGN